MNGSLPQSERSLAEQHILICEGCRLELELVRAIGSQEKAPAVGKDDWTLDRIFGAEKNSGGASPAASAEPAPAESASPSSDPAGDAAAESLFGPAMPRSSPAPPAKEPVPAESAAETPRPWGKRAGSAPAEGASWDFEPADAKSNVKPPEQSLFFAAEALTRRKDVDSKKGNFRVILWGAGGLVGAALLAFSSYFVLHMNAPAPDASTPAPQAPAAGETGTTTPNAPPATAPGTVQPPANNPPTEETAPPPDNSAQVAPAAPPRVSASSVAPQPLPLAARATGPAPTKRTPTATTPRPRPLSSAPRSSAPVEPHIVPAPSTATPRSVARSPEEPESTTSSGDTSSPEPALGSTTDNGHGWSDGSEDVVTTPKPPRPATRGSSMWQSQTPKPEDPQPAAPAPEVSSPIEHLHLATVAAEEHGDLDALRRLRVTWKAFMVKIVGPDRSRAKREYADCLWAIQDLTGRRADQKDTLAAYREYLLGAPAGGADSRSVSRLRQLEDAISEQR